MAISREHFRKNSIFWITTKGKSLGKMYEILYRKKHNLQGVKSDLDFNTT